MFRNLRVRKQPEKIASDDPSISAEQLSQDADLPITLRQINHLPENARKHIFRSLLPPDLLGRFGIDPITWNCWCSRIRPANGFKRTMIITDFGHQFEPSDASAPDVLAGLEDRPTGGFGLYFIYQTMDEVGYETTQAGNQLTLIKNMGK